jgi:acetylornithine deacetylase
MTVSNTFAIRLAETLDRDDALALLRGAIARESITGNEANFVAMLKDEMACRECRARRFPPRSSQHLG